MVCHTGVGRDVECMCMCVCHITYKYSMAPCDVVCGRLKAVSVEEVRGEGHSAPSDDGENDAGVHLVGLIP